MRNVRVVATLPPTWRSRASDDYHDDYDDDYIDYDDGFNDYDDDYNDYDNLGQLTRARQMYQKKKDLSSVEIFSQKYSLVYFAKRANCDIAKRALPITKTQFRNISFTQITPC